MSPTLVLSVLAAQAEAPPEVAPNATCIICHQAGGADEMTVDTHRGSLMALAGLDPFFRAAWEIARYDDEEVAGLCARCAGCGPGSPTSTRTERAPPQDLEALPL